MFASSKQCSELTLMVGPGPWSVPIGSSRRESRDFEVCAVYDALGNRVEKTVAGSDSQYVYDRDGHVNTVLSNGSFQRMYIYLNGQPLAEYFANTTYFVHQDHLGSARLVTSSHGTHVLIESDDYYPFGEQIPPTGGTTDIYKFTGKERDTESGLDMFGARYYGSSIGRFVTPDYQDDEEPPDAVPNASTSDPQTLNLYSYVGDRPTRRIDLDGHTETGPCFNDPNSQCFNGSYNGERDCSGSAGCLFWSGQTHEWQANDPTAPSSSDLPGWWFTGFMRLTLNDPYGLKQMGYAVDAPIIE